MTPDSGILPLSAKDIRKIPLTKIDREDLRFQSRISAATKDLKQSLGAHGQQSPVTLWLCRGKYKIVDGFRRIDALEALEATSVQAIVRDDLTEEQAHVLSFVENVRRRNLSPVDKANAIWRAVHCRGIPKSEVAKIFALSIRQIDRYLQVLQFADPLQRAVIDNKISMAHAVLLHKADVDRVDEWIETIQSQRVSLSDLKSELTLVFPARRRSTYLRRDAKGFRLAPLRFRMGMSRAERVRIQEALRTALDIVEQSV